MIEAIKFVGDLLPVGVLGMPAFAAAMLAWKFLALDDRHVQAIVYLLALGCAGFLAAEHVRSVRIEAAMASVKLGSRLSDVPVQPAGATVVPMTNPETWGPVEPPVSVHQVYWRNPSNGRLWFAEVDPSTDKVLLFYPYVGSGVFLPSPVRLIGQSAAVGPILATFAWLVLSAWRRASLRHREGSTG